MTIIIREISRHPITGAGQAGVTVSVKKVVGGTTIDDDTSDANGVTEFAHDDVGYPGPVQSVQTVGADTTYRSGQVAGQVAGLYWEADVPDVFEMIGYGVHPEIGDALAVSAQGDSMQVDIGTGIMLHKGGLPYVMETAGVLTIPTSDSSNDRIDRIVIRQTREGESEQGKMELMVLEGTPGSSPSPPSLTQSSTTWDYSLARVEVGTNVSVIASNKVIDERANPSLSQNFLVYFPENRAQGNMFYVNSARRISALAVGTSSQVLKGGSIPAWGTLSASDLGLDVSESELNELDGISGNVQDQLDGKVGDFTQYFTATVLLGNGIDVITADEPSVVFTIPEACTLIGVQLESIEGGGGNLRINVARAIGLATLYTDIDASSPITLSNSFITTNTTLSGWTTSMDQYDKIKVTVDSAVTPATIKRAAATFRFSKARS